MMSPILRAQLNITLSEARRDEFLAIARELSHKNQALALRRLMHLYELAKTQAPALLRELEEVE